MHRGPDQFAQAAPVAVLERRPLALAVVGQHHETVRARSVRGGAIQPAEVPVEPAQRVESVIALGAGMVGNLVVADEIGVDDRARQVQVSDQCLGRHVPADHRGEGPQERVQPAAPDPRADVVAALPGRLGTFPRDLGHEPGEGAHGVIGHCEIRVVALAHPPALMARDAHGQDVLLGVAGVQIPPADPVGVQQAPPV
jgi:hypothetical protein